MSSLNYKHLHYFWAVAKYGSIIIASKHLHITPQTISAQLSLFEQLHGEKLFYKSGRKLMLTETGRMVQHYANEIFSLGQELEEVLRHHPQSRSLVLRVGISDAVPKSIAYKLLEPALQLPQQLRMSCREGKVESLLAELVMHKLDLVISDGPMPPTSNVRGYSHFLCSSTIDFFATAALAQRWNAPFPACLNGAPLLLQGEDTAVRSKLLHWLSEQHITPMIVGEFDDGALLMAFGKAGGGFFAAPSHIADLIIQQYQVEKIGTCLSVHEHFYAISIERQLTHPAVVAIQQAALDTTTSFEQVMTDNEAPL